VTVNKWDICNSNSYSRSTFFLSTSIPINSTISLAQPSTTVCSIVFNCVSFISSRNNNNLRNLMLVIAGFILLNYLLRNTPAVQSITWEQFVTEYLLPGKVRTLYLLHIYDIERNHNTLVIVRTVLLFVVKYK